MKFNPRSFITIFMLCLLLILGACSSAPAESEKGPPSLDKYLSANDKAESAAESRKEEEAKKEANKSPISNDIRSYEIMIKDEVFKFPMTLKELENTSFTYCGETPLNEAIAEPGIKYEALYTNGESKVIFNLLNLTDEATTADNTIVAGLFIQFDESDAIKREDVTLPSNVSPTYADLNSLKSVYGEPSEVFHDSQVGNPKASKLIYRTMNGTGLYSYTIFVDNEEHQVREIVILSSGE